ncbi:WO male-killing family protein Wmk [Wolbachia endosymbiont (group B) of Ischnura elegans]|uniref:WO male-killing family protein Wmk n=1 Tax=Wolbachia endosymbiont (group B) of Ischnura elegans TaxID=2954021 RepID=UPI0022319FE7|nr:helix-turn-helix transcriptional regulator [Wolbachia endosymbiont (group B) of Ischnura elegans]
MFISAKIVNNNTKNISPARYKIAQKIRSWRLKQKYTLKDLVEKTGIKYHTLLRYEQGACGIPTKKLKVIAEALSVHVGSLFPRQKVLRENCSFNKEWMIAKIKGQESCKLIRDLTGFIQAEEENNVKAARVSMAKNLAKVGFDNDIIYRATGLSTEEYDNKEKKGSEHSNEGQEIKKWRIIRGYTQEDLARELDIGPSQIHHYEQGSATILSERLWEIAEKLSVNAEDLMKKYEEDSYKAENELLSWVRESKKIDNQESRDELGIWVEFLSQRKQVYKEKIYKAEAIKVANNLRMLDVSIDAISKITDLSIEELENYAFKT